MDIEVNGNIITIRSETEETIDLGKLREQLSVLENMVPPTQEELLEIAQSGIVHPYYSPSRRNDIEELNRKISYYESLIENL
jgi:hypothetical protein